MPRLRAVLALAAAVALVLGFVPGAQAHLAQRAPKSEVSVTFRLGEFFAGGRVISARDACAVNRSVVLLGQDDQTGAIVGDESYISDDEGRWGSASEQARGGSASAFALVPGSRRCDVAQSPRRPITARRAPADVRVSFRVAEPAISGRVTSSDRSCVSRVRVVFLTREARQPWEYSGVSVRTDRQGRYTYSRQSRVRGGGGSAIAVVPAERGCDVAQSPSRRVR